MNEEHRQELYAELVDMRTKLRYALDNLNDLSKRDAVKGKIENVYFTLDELSEQIKGEPT
jgi:hypothetical protein